MGRPPDCDDNLCEITCTDQPCIDPFLDCNCAQVWEECLAHEACSHQVFGDVPSADASPGCFVDPEGSDSGSVTMSASDGVSLLSLAPSAVSTGFDPSVVDLLDAQIARAS